MKILRLFFLKINEVILPYKVKQLSLKTGNSELLKISEFLKKNTKEMIPYKFSKTFRNMPVEIEKDNVNNLSYVYFNNYKVYYPETYTKEDITFAFRTALLEQYIESPHRYNHSVESELKGKGAILIGASDCIFALSIINNFNRLLLIEADPAWLKPMNITLKDYQDKIEIINKFVSDTKSQDTINLDLYFAGMNSDFDFIQMDVEGNELKVLKGAELFLKNSKKLKLSVCCYHTYSQETEVREYLESLDFRCSLSKGFINPLTAKPLKSPYLRKGVVYAEKVIL